MVNNNIYCCISAVVILLCCSIVYGNPNVNGYHFSGTLETTQIKFTQQQNLIVVPVMINDKKLNLVLDTGVRSLILFGKRCKKLTRGNALRTVQFHAFGKNKQVEGELFLGNHLVLGDVENHNVGIIVIKNNGPFHRIGFNAIHGIIGYELFHRFRIRIDYPNQVLTLSEPNYTFKPGREFSTYPIIIRDTRPYLNAQLKLTNGNTTGRFYIDTGSTHDLILFTKMDKPKKGTYRERIGYGLAGAVVGYNAGSGSIRIGKHHFESIDIKMMKKEFCKMEFKDAQGSIGAGMLQNHVIIIDYITRQVHIT